MRIELATEPSAPDHLNEDFVSVTLPASGQGGSLVLLDGVTPPQGPSGCEHSVPWFTARLGGALAELSVSREDLTLREILSLSILRTAEVHRTSCDLSHPRTPQSTVVLARWDDAALEYLVLSDSVLLLEDSDGTVVPVLDDRLDRLPPHIDELRAGVRALPEGSPERAAAASAYVDGVEALRNAPGGFFTAAADPSVAGLAVTGSVPRARLRAFAAVTDGAGRWVEVFSEGTWADLFRLLRAKGPQSLVDQVRAMEATTRVSGKQHDDATAALLEP
ncbi:hypothetical protein AB0J21_25720 [Streptomyces sp. NPDC049954]|uniref:hypothetical protein n=1 Tax=Streptomyces sp. NPDC049954 TaxID=3155779 RepID=UPI003449342E